MKPSFNRFTRFAPAANSSLKPLVMVACIFATAGYTAKANEITWGNTAASWSTGSNWVGGKAPANSLTQDTALFNNTAFGFHPTTGTTHIAGITVGNGNTTTGTLTFSNTALTLGASGIIVNGNGANGVGQVNLTDNVILGATQTWTNNAYVTANGTAGLKTGTLTTAANLGAVTLTLAGSGSSGTVSGLSTASNNFNIDLLGIVSQGSGSTLSVVVNTTGTGIVSFNNANTFTGGVTIKSGVAQFANNTSGGTGTITLGNTSGSAAATLRMGTAIASNAIAVAAGSTGTLAIENVYNTNTVFTGPVTLNNNLLLTSQGGGAGTLTMSGGFTGTGNLTLNSIATSSGITLSTNAINMVGTVTNSGAGTGTNTISSAIGSNVTGVTQNSVSSKLLLTGTNTYSGPTTVTAGTLQLNRASGSLSSSSNLTMGGGSFVFDNAGATTATSQSLNALTFHAGESTVLLTHTVAQNEVLAFTSLAARTAGATGTFYNSDTSATNSAANGFTLGNVTANRFIDRGMFFANPTSPSLTNYAWYDSTGYVRAINYGVDANSATRGSATTLASIAHQRFTGPISAQATATFTTLNVSAGNNMTLAAGSIVTVDGILKNTGSAATISGGTGIQASYNSELVIYTSAAQNDYLTISTAILANGSNALTKSGPGVLTLSGINTYTGATTVNGGILTFLNTASRTGGSLVTAGALGTIGLGVGATSGDYNSTDVDHLFNNTLSGFTMNATSGVALDTTAGNFTQATNLSGTRALTKLGVNALTLTGANTYTGTTTVEKGVLHIQNGSALGTTAGNTIIRLGAELQLQGGITVDGEFVHLSGTGISNTGALRNISGNNTWTGTINLVTYPTRINSDADTLTLSGVINSAHDLTFGGAGNTISSNVIQTGIGTLTKDGTGTLTLSGANTFTGTTTISAGTLQLGNGGTTGSLSTSSTITNNGTLIINRSNAVRQGTDFSGAAFTGTGAFVQAGAGTTTLTANNTYTGGTTISAGTLSVAASGALGLENNSLAIAGGATLQVTGSFNTSRSTILGGTAGATTGGTFEVATGKILTYTSSSVISGTGSLIKTGGGTLSLGGVDTYIGGTYIKAGTLVSTSGQAPGPQPPAGSNLYAHHIYDGATLQIAVGSWATERQIQLMGDKGGIGGGAKIEITNGFTQLRNGLIYGLGKLDLVGTGTMIVTNANTYEGGTSITNGVLQVRNSSGSATGTGAVTVGSGGTLQGSATAGYGIITGSVIVGSGGNLLASSVTSGGSTLTLAGGLTLNDRSLSTFQLGAWTSTPLVNLTSGSFMIPGASVIDIINTGSMGAGTYHLFNYTGADPTFSNLTLAEPSTGLYNLSLTNNTGWIGLAVTAITAQWKLGGTDTNWSTAGNWYVAVPNSIGADALFLNNNGSGFGATAAVTIDGDQTVGSLVFDNAATAFTINASSGALILDEVGNGNVVIQVINTSGANHGISAPITLNDNLHVVTAAGLDINGAISESTAGKLLTKSGTGALTLNGTAANTYTGLTEVVEGTLNLNKTPGIHVIGTGGLQIDFGATATLLASNQIADSATVTVNGTFALGSSSETLAILAGGGAVTTGSGSVLTLSSTTDSTFTGIISGAGGLAKAGAGTLTLNGVNTYTGGTAINGGILQAGADNNLGNSSGGLAFGGGSLSFSGSFTSARDLTLNSGGGTLDTDGSSVVLTGLISGGTGNTLTKNGSGTIALSHANTYTGETVVNDGILRVGNGLSLGTTAAGTTVNADGEIELAGNGLTVSETLTLHGGTLCNLANTNTYAGAITLTADSELDADAGTLIITGVIGGSYGLIKAGPGVVELAGTIPNTYSGGTIVNVGTLTATGTSALGAITGTLAVNNINTTAAGTAVVLNLSTTAATTTGSLSGTIATATDGTNTATINNGGQLLTVNQTSAGTYAGVLAGTGGLTLGISSTNTLTLSGINTYSGVTTVSAGKLTIASSGTLNSASAVSIGAGEFNYNSTTALVQGISFSGTGGTLSGTGTIGTVGNTVTVASGNTHAPGGVGA
ncbi:MAG: autotransporter-associated beta strand repeat-containing protein, partial [Verrucomicrobia bacterium]|nr:autotransporter-associated beta strand repeat-containing protein [Verrucomicrobiota bacterium]